MTYHLRVIAFLAVLLGIGVLVFGLVQAIGYSALAVSSGDLTGVFAGGVAFAVGTLCCGYGLARAVTPR